MIAFKTNVSKLTVSKKKNMYELTKQSVYRTEGETEFNF
jgi:hypothetical protein